MLTLHYTITKEDYINYYTYMYWDGKNKWRKTLLHILKQVGLVGLYIAILYFTNIMGSFNKIAIYIFLAIFVSSILPALTGRYQVKRQAEAIAENIENESIFKQVMLTASNTGVEVKTDILKTIFSWSAFTKKIETENYFYLFQNGMQAIILPKRAFESTSQKIDFDKLLSVNLTLESELNSL